MNDRYEREIERAGKEADRRRKVAKLHCKRSSRHRQRMRQARWKKRMDPPGIAATVLPKKPAPPADWERDLIEVIDGVAESFDRLAKPFLVKPPRVSADDHGHGGEG